MSEDVLSRVRKLVALAASTAEEEARTSAVTACRLILEHKLTIAQAIAETAEEVREERAAAKPSGADRWKARRDERERRAAEAKTVDGADLPEILGRAGGSVLENLLRRGLRR